MDIDKRMRSIEHGIRARQETPMLPVPLDGWTYSCAESNFPAECSDIRIGSLLSKHATFPITSEKEAFLIHYGEDNVPDMVPYIWWGEQTPDLLERHRNRIAGMKDYTRPVRIVRITYGESEHGEEPISAMWADNMHNLFWHMSEGRETLGEIDCYLVDVYPDEKKVIVRVNEHVRCEDEQDLNNLAYAGVKVTRRVCEAHIANNYTLDDFLRDIPGLLDF